MDMETVIVYKKTINLQAQFLQDGSIPADGRKAAYIKRKIKFRKHFHRFCEEVLLPT